MNTKERITNHARTRRVARMRARIRGTAEQPRLAVSRTLKHISAQVIDDTSGRTLAAASDRELTKKSTPVEAAAEVGKLLAERAVAHGVTQVVFDRRDKRYHGRVKALAEGARIAGLKF